MISDQAIPAPNAGSSTTISSALPAGNNNIGDVDVASIAAGDNNIGNVDIVTVPTDPFGANADAASATGSISAKLRFIASTGIPITGTVTVGSHAVTNAGTFVVQENGAGLTALQLIDDVVYVDDTSTHSTGSTKGVGIMAVATPTDGSVNANDIGMVAMTTDRKLHVSVQDALPAGTNAIGKLAANSGVDIGDVDITSVTPGTGATNLGKAEDAAHTTGDVGVMALAVRSAAPSERSAGPTDGDYEPLATNEVGAVWASLTPSANGGASTFMASGSDGSTILVATKQTIKASAGVLYGYYAYNPEAAVSFVHFYNTDTVTVGTTNPQMTIAIPAGSAANLALPYGIGFSTAISCSATTTAGGNTAPATGVSLVAWYK